MDIQPREARITHENSAIDGAAGGRHIHKLSRTIRSCDGCSAAGRVMRVGGDTGVVPAPPTRCP